MSNTFDAIRSSIPLAYLIFFPILVIVVNPVSVASAAHELTAYRMQQYELQGSSYGGQHSMINSEARTFESASYDRRCVLMRSDDLSVMNYNKVLQNNPTSIIVLINNNMTEEQAQTIMGIEDDLLNSEPKVPVYFAYEEAEILDIYSKVTKATQASSGSAAQALLDSAFSIGYHLTSSGEQSKPMLDHPIVNIQGALTGVEMPENLPTIAIVAHYDSFGVSPLLSHGANSDASGVVALLEIARVLGKLYADPKTHPRYNVLFLVAGGGKFNYLGSRKWIEDAMESSSYANTHHSTHLLPTAKLVLCLDALANSETSTKPEALHMHVSKPPKAGSVAHTIHANIEKASENMYKQINTDIVHKKISINAELSAWEHEKYSKRRFHAATLSTLSSHDDPLRRSIMDTKERMSYESLDRNIKIVTRSIVNTIFGIDQDSQTDLVTGDFSISKDRISSLVDFLTSQTRAQQQIGSDHIVITTLKKELETHLKPSNVHTSTLVADKRDPEYLFYSGMKIKISASVIRSAVFDLYLTLSIALYMFIIYCLVVKFDVLLGAAKNYGLFPKVKSA